VREDVGGHQSGGDLESYSLGRLAASLTAAFEWHLLICQGCRTELTAIETYNFVHYTGDGPFHSRITKLRTGRVFARHWGRIMEGGKEFRTCGRAKAFLVRTFVLIFPEHACTARCGSTNST
jgi:hypothetical protein